jgi:integrase
MSTGQATASKPRKAAKMIGSVEVRARSVRVVWMCDGVKRTESFRLRSEAEAFREALTATGGEYPPGWANDDHSDVTVADVFRERVNADVAVSARAATLRKFETMMGDHRMAKTPVRDVTERDGRELVRELGDRYANGTVRVFLGQLRAAFRYATARGYVSGPSPIPARLDRSIGTPKKDIASLERWEVDALVAAVPDAYRLFVRVLFASGLRIGEAYALRGHSVKGRDGRVTLKVDRSMDINTGELGPTKNRKPRMVALPVGLSGEVAALAKSRAPGDRLFTLPPYRNFHRVWTKAVDDAGLRDEHPHGVRIHDTRHTHASALIMANVPLVKVSRRLGHSSITITANTYGHLQEDDELLFSELDAQYGGGE